MILSKYNYDNSVRFDVTAQRYERLCFDSLYKGFEEEKFGSKLPNLP